MNRIQAVSSGYSEMVSYTPAGWVVVGVMFVLAFFLVGYLVLSRMNRAKMEKRRQARREEIQAASKKRNPKL